MNGLFTYYMADSFLHRRNPSLKLLSLMILVLAVTMAFDPWTPLVFFVVAMAIQLILGRVALRHLLLPLSLLFVLGAWGFVGSNAFFYLPPASKAVTILWQWGSLRVTLEGLRVGVALTLRMMAIVTFSMIFITTTDPTDFVLSLIQHAHFPFRLGYGILVAYRFMPLWRTELDIIRSAHRIRGVGERMTLKGRWEQLRRYAVPLLASAIRKSERVAIAMDSKAFGVSPIRTYYRQLVITWKDWGMLAGAIVLTGVILIALAKAGLLVGYGFVPED